MTAVAEDILQKDLEDATCLLANQATNSLDSATLGQTADGRLGDSLDVFGEKWEEEDEEEGGDGGYEGKRRSERHVG